MRIVVQRVSEAAVTVGQEVVGAIGSGYLLLVGIGINDKKEDAEKLAEKVSKLRVFTDREGKMNLGIKEVGGEVLSISQFTLYGDLTKGNRPSFTASADAKQAKELYMYFNDCLIAQGLTVKTGVFQAEMKVSLINDGPVTVIYESEDF